MDSFYSTHQRKVSLFEPFQAYLVFLSGTDRLYLSYAQSYDTDGSLKMSPYLRRITEYLSVPVERKEHLTIESDPNCYVRDLQKRNQYSQ